MIFRAWVTRSGPKSTEVRTTWQRAKTGMTSSFLRPGWRKYNLAPLSRPGRSGPLQDKNPARPNHTNFMACDYNIELIFKSWKSYLHLASLPTTKEDTTLCYLYGRMLLIVLHDALCPQVRAHLWKQKKRELSLLKLMRHCQAFAERWMQAIFQSALALRRFLTHVCATAERLAAKASRKRRTTAQILQARIIHEGETRSWDSPPNVL